MFGMGSGYADLLRPEDALRQDREKMEQIELSESNATNNNNSEKVCRVKTILRKSFHGVDEIESQEESNNLTDIRKEWKEVFQKLDNADGTSDGRIDRKALVKWVSALNLKKTIEFEANLNISPRNLERLVSRADHDKDGFVDEEEFLTLISNEDENLSKRQQSLLHQYLKVAAYAEEYHWCPPPLFILTLTAVQIGIYIYHVVHFKKFHKDLEITWSGPEPICSKLIYDPSRRYECWRFFSYCLVHSGIQHILFNMLMQLFVGLPLEMSHGSIRVATVYISGVIAGSLGTSSLDPNVFLAGASGGVYALIAAHLATLILNWREDIVIMRKRFRTGKATSAKHGHITRTIRLLTVLLYGGVDTGLAIYNRHIRENESVKTSYVAHLCGALAGFLIGLIVLKNRKVEHWERKLKACCVIVFLVLVIAAIIWNLIGNTVAQEVQGGNSTFFQDDDMLMQSPDYLKQCHDNI